MTVGLTRISMDEASKLVNRTVPIPEEPGNYMVTLNVFHHLHCLVSQATLVPQTSFAKMQEKYHRG